jgi:hypothetical protein
MKTFSIAGALLALIMTGVALTNANPGNSREPQDDSPTPTPKCCSHDEAGEHKADSGKPSCCQKADAAATEAPQCRDCAGDAEPAQAPSCKECDTAAKAAASTESKPACSFCRSEGRTEKCEDCRKSDIAAAVTAVGAGELPGPGHGRGYGRGHGASGDSEHAADDRHEKDHQDFFFLVEHREKIHRTVENLPDGIETVTESDNAEVAGKIQEHVESMYDRVENGNPIRMRDPLFREIFANADRITMTVEHTEKGVRVRETSKDAYVVKLLQEHAKVVDLFIKNGYAELPRNHKTP